MKKKEPSIKVIVIAVSVMKNNPNFKIHTTFLFADIQIWDDFSTLNMTFKLGFLKNGEAVSGANRIQHELQIALL